MSESGAGYAQLSAANTWHAPQTAPIIDHGGQLYDVRAYGASGDGTADDTEPIQSAIDAAAAAGGGIVFLPALDFIATQLRMKTKVRMCGAGWATRIIQHPSTDGHLIILDNVNVESTVLCDLTVHGNKDNQTTPNDCVNYDNTAGTFSFGDPVHIIQRVLFYIAKNNGLTLSADSRESRVSDCFATGCDGNGYAPNCTDSVLVNCTSGASGLSGWRLGGDNCRLVNCKSFGSGRLLAVGQQAGFEIRTRRLSMTGCEAQDNNQHGYLIYDLVEGEIALTGCIADSNAVATAGSGFHIDTATEITITGCLAFDRNPAGSRHQRFGLELANTVTPDTNAKLDVTMVCQDNIDGDTSMVPYPPSSRVFVNGSDTKGHGTATLTAGSVAVVDASITATSTIQLSRQTSAGTVGELSVSLTAGTGFTITSSNAADTSSVYWQVQSYSG